MKRTKRDLTPKYAQKGFTFKGKYVDGVLPLLPIEETIALSRKAGNKARYDEEGNLLSW